MIKINISKYCLNLITLLFLTIPLTSNATDDQQKRIVSVGGGLTEILYALGSEEQIVGVDTTSKWPKEAQEKAQVGYQRRLSAEGILSLRPTLLLLTESAGPPEVLEQIKKAGVPITILETQYSVSGVIDNIHKVAKLLDKNTQGTQLANKLKKDYEQLQIKLKTLSNKPKTAFLLGMGKGSPMVSGSNTGAANMINLAGGENAFSNIDNYKQVSVESMIAAAPEVILIAGHAIRGKKVEELLKLKSISQTPAAKNKRIYIVDTLLMLGYGPRIVEAIDTLIGQVHGTAVSN